DGPDARRPAGRGLVEPGQVVHLAPSDRLERPASPLRKLRRKTGTTEESCYDMLRNAKVCKTREKTQTLTIPVLLRNSAWGESTLLDREVGSSNLFSL